MKIGKFNLELKPLPHVWWKTDLSGTVNGKTKFLFIKLDEERADKSTYEHELVHIKQTYFVNVLALILLLLVYPPISPLALGVYAFLYTVSQRFRFEMEAMAFAKSCEVKSFPKDPDRWFNWVSTFLAKVYDLDARVYTEEKIYNRVKYYWERFYKQ